MKAQVNKIFESEKNISPNDKPLYHKNCGETMIEAGIKKYGINADYKQISKCFAPFGHGCMTGKTCGAFAGAVGVIGLLFAEEKPTDNKIMKQAVKEFSNKFFEKYESNDCAYIRKHHLTPRGCDQTIEDTAVILEEVLKKYL